MVRHLDDLLGTQPTCGEGVRSSSHSLTSVPRSLWASLSPPELVSFGEAPPYIYGLGSAAQMYAQAV